MTKNRKFRGIKFAAVAVASVVLLSTGSLSSASAEQRLQKCNQSRGYASEAEELAQRVKCYLRELAYIKDWRDYISRLEQAGIKVRGELEKGTSKTYKDCDYLWVIFKTYRVGKTSKNGKCSDLLNKQRNLRDEYFRRYCHIGRSHVASDMNTLQANVKRLGDDYRKCFSDNINDALTKGDWDYKATLGNITDRNSFIRVLKGARQKYTDENMQQDFRDLGNACDALLARLQAKHPGIITKYGFMSCRVK